MVFEEVLTGQEPDAGVGAWGSQSTQHCCSTRYERRVGGRTTGQHKRRYTGENSTPSFVIPHSEGALPPFTERLSSTPNGTDGQDYTSANANAAGAVTSLHHSMHNPGHYETKNSCLRK